ncbi:hypothetical protein M3611_26645 [Priestia megaterium]|uniref:hypothetical protein n=1 Tax=Priestia megaterium TaxID=1404 RepID=UPI00203DDB82|nr:hypothetical protein [Priestia megaterium]MCM3155574.1 hypothetical protein [Priestia megaterium]
MNQIDIFDILDNQPVVERQPVDPVAEFAKGDFAMIKSYETVIAERGHLDAEDEHFFKTFGGKKGMIDDIYVGALTKVLSYRMTLKNDAVVWCNAGDMIYV